MYLFPCCSTALKAAYYPYHKYFGMGVLAGSVAAALMGKFLAGFCGCRTHG